MKTLLKATTLALGIGAALAPIASAQNHAPEPGFKAYSQHFVTPLDQAAWGPNPPYVVVSPYGTKDINCAAWAGWINCYQLDPGGARHDLVQLPFGVFGKPRIFVLNPF
jgi:hypothetical protein